jgi:isopentenyl diphosphate isomerase/L-lactate dehydrogenase-like FMN-dependent dehydrogenase
VIDELKSLAEALRKTMLLLGVKNVEELKHIKVKGQSAA